MVVLMVAVMENYKAELLGRLKVVQWDDRRVETTVAW
jgi:hypothetical protein